MNRREENTCWDYRLDPPAERFALVRCPRCRWRGTEEDADGEIARFAPFGFCPRRACGHALIEECFGDE